MIEEEPDITGEEQKRKFDLIDGNEMLKMTFEDVTNTAGGGEQPWNPDQEGEQIIGQLIELRKHIGQYDQLVYVLRDTNEQVRTIFSTKMLKQLMEPIDIGEVIRITYKGKRSNHQGAYYKVYKVERQV